MKSQPLFWMIVAVVAAIFTTPEPLAAADRPNVIIIVADDLGLQLGCYGDKVAKTPHIDRLATEGTRFTRAYCTTASCSASRSVILSGLFNHATGHYGHAHGTGHFSTYESVRSLPNLLGEAGYRTCLIGKYHLAPEPVYHFETERQQGTMGARHTVRMAQNAREWITEKDDRPFFLYFCPTDPHRAGKEETFANFASDPNHYPGITPVAFDPAEMQLPPWLPDHPEVRQEWAEFYRAITRVDAGVGELMKMLADTGHDKNTLVMFLSDNGPPFPGAKTTAYEPGLNLPLIVRDPRQSRRGLVTDAVVNWADLTPTVLDYCGVKVPPAPPLRPMENAGKPVTAGPLTVGKTQPYRFHGRSFAGILGEEHPQGWDELFASHTFHEVQMYYPMRVAWVGQFKYILNIAHGLEYPFASDLYASPTWQGVLARKNPEEMYGQRTVRQYLHHPKHELYNLAADPKETKNLAEDPAYQSTLEQLQGKLKAWQERTKDPWVTKWEYE